MRRTHVCLLLSLFSALQCAIAQQWEDNSFEDFSKGYFDDSGQNIYVSKKGEIRTIRKFDVNNDGFIDLIFNSTHDDDAGAPVSIATILNSEKRIIRTNELHIRGSLRAVVRDVNNDGVADIIFCPNPSGIQNQRRFVHVAYGNNEGWNESRINGILPVYRIKELTVADVNHDGWPDILTLNGTSWIPDQPNGNILRIFWGSEHGFILTNYKDVGVGEASKIASGDFDTDGIEDVALLNNDHVSVFWGDRSIFKTDDYETMKVGFSNIGPKCITAVDMDNNGCSDIIVGSSSGSVGMIAGAPNRRSEFQLLLTDVPATSISVADVDGDNNNDLIVSNFNLQRALGGELLGGSDLDNKYITIFWGEKGGFSKSNSSKLDAPYTVHTAVVDYDGDGENDIICATHQSSTRFTTESKIFWGNGKRTFKEAEQGIKSHGAFHVTTLPPLPGKNLPQILVSNTKTGTLREEVPLLIYYGSSDGFNEGNVTKIPFRSGYEASAVDLNEDGYVDLLTVNSMHGGGADDPNRGLNIFWGTETGLEISNRTVMNETNISTTNVADLNKDGYLDIVIGSFDRYDKKPTKLIIYYGTEKGHNVQNRVEILSEGRSTSPNIADYNNDGWLDIAVSSYSLDKIRVFYGGVDGFDEKNQKMIAIPSIIDLETADLNSDGYLDIVASSYKDKIDNFHDTGVTIFWGDAEGFKEWNGQWLEANTALGPLVADLDNDGYLDLFLPSYHGDNTRENLPSYIYWGSHEGFRLKNRSKLIVDSASDAFSSDFNNDGLLDLVVAEHAKNWAQSTTSSRIYYNDGQRFTSNNVNMDKLPAPGPHWMWNYDIGNIFNRRFESTYFSAVKEWDHSATQGVIDVEAETTLNSKLLLFVRSSNNKESLENKNWLHVTAKTFTVDKGDRCFQYKLIFQSANGSDYPIVSKVSVKISKEKLAEKITVIDKEVCYVNTTDTTKYRAIPSDPDFYYFRNIPSIPRNLPVPFEWESENFYSSNGGYMTDNIFLEPDKPWILQLCISTPGKGDTQTGSAQYKIWYRISNDNGSTFTPLRQVIAEGYTGRNPIKGVQVGRNGYNVDFTRPIVRASNDEIMVPIGLHPWDEEKNDIYLPLSGAFLFQDAGVLIGKWLPDGSDIAWNFGEWLRIDHHKSTRGLSEPTIVELNKNGHFAMISRGSNLARLELPCHAWVSFSDDYCRSWSEPEPLTYSTGERFYVTTAHSTLFKSRINGKTYWLGNLQHDNPRASIPRYPLVIGEVDLDNFGIIKETVVEIDTRQPNDGGENLQLSNFKILENNKRAEIIVALTRREGSQSAPYPSWYRIKLN